MLRDGTTLELFLGPEHVEDHPRSRGEDRIPDARSATVIVLPARAGVLR